MLIKSILAESSSSRSESPYVYESNRFCTGLEVGCVSADFYFAPFSTILASVDSSGVVLRAATPDRTATSATEKPGFAPAVAVTAEAAGDGVYASVSVGGRDSGGQGASREVSDHRCRSECMRERQGQTESRTAPTSSAVRKPRARRAPATASTSDTCTETTVSARVIRRCRSASTSRATSLSGTRMP